MALFDRMRDRLRGQVPIGAAEDMQNRGFGARLPQLGRPRVEPQTGGQMWTGQQGTPQQNRYGLQHNQMSENELNGMGNMQRPEELDAFMMGRRMGLNSMNEMRNQSVPGAEAMMGPGRIMTPERLNSAMNTLLRYRSGKSSVNKRVVKAQQWWKLKNWEQIRQEKGIIGTTEKPANTGWLWNCIVGKHADAIDSFPEPIILPREADDKEEADKLSKIIPVVLEKCGFEETYNQCMWQKMQEGTGCYGIFWDSSALNGLGDVAIPKVNILNLYWEPGVSDIEDSKNLFYLSYVDMDELEEAYPDLKGRLTSAKLFIEKYNTDDNIDMSNKAVVIDWYYKKRVGQRTVLHYCKFVGEECLYSSEEEGLDEGYYTDGEYPFVLDPLFPVEGSPAGYGYIDIAKDEQTSIDVLSQAMTTNAVLQATPRYFMRADGSVNEQEFMDASKPIIHVQGSLGQDALRQVEVNGMGSDAHNMLQQKIDAIKFITGNTDVNNGGVPSGVTAASAIAALKEDSGRSSKDSTKASYRAYRKLCNKLIERLRQFYDIPRWFRILGTDGKEDFTIYSNANLKTQELIALPGQDPALRQPVFDVEVRAQRENAYTKMSQNELALQFYDKGLLNPQMTDQALIVLDMMDFRGKEELRKRIIEQGTMKDMLVQIFQVALAMAQAYNPQMIPQLTAIIQGVTADMNAKISAGGGGTTRQLAPDSEMGRPHDPRENALVRRAAERSANASRPS